MSRKLQQDELKKYGIIDRGRHTNHDKKKTHNKRTLKTKCSIYNIGEYENGN